ncbi:MAG: hypothetical protein ACI92C_002307, partial [Neolewinella sp.]
MLWILVGRAGLETRSDQMTLAQQESIIIIITFVIQLNKP